MFVPHTHTHTHTGQQGHITHLYKSIKWQQLTCSCGSIMRGHRRPLVTNIAFSVDTASLGKPSAFHWRISNGSAKTFKNQEMRMLQDLFNFTFNREHCFRHCTDKQSCAHTQTHPCRHTHTNMHICLQISDSELYHATIRRIRTDPLIYEVHPTTYLFKYAIFSI